MRQCTKSARMPVRSAKTKAIATAVSRAIAAYKDREGERWTAIEPEEWMRERAEQRLKPHIQLRAGVAESLPFEDGSLDWALCTLVLCSVQQPERSLQELRRVLKPQGELLFLEHVRGQGWKGRLHDWCTPWWSWLVHGCHLNRATGDALQRQFVVEEVERLEIASVPFVFGRARPR